MIFPVIFAALYVSHFALLRVPYYWDEAGYYIPAAWDFFRTGSLIPITTLTNAHPPLPSIYLALWWKASGFFPEVTREAVLMVASLGLLAVWKLAMRLVGVGAVAFWTVALTALYPEFAGPRRHLCRGLHLVGTGLRAARSGSKSLACRFMVRRCSPMQGDGHCHPAYAGRGQPGRGLPRHSGGASQELARGCLAYKLRASAGLLVRMALREDRLLVRQSGVPALQRRGYA
jgi:hypothetical protein